MAFHVKFYMVFVLFYSVKAAISTHRPNIILIIADDMGWNDVSYHGSNQILTPNIDALAYNGIILNSHYVPALCTPSRASLLTGKYPTSIGMQHMVILASEPWGLPLEETLMPEYFKRHGYSTHAIGKWHLGFYKKEYTPTYRGFDTHFGYWNGYQDYYDHTSHDDTLESAPKPLKGYDMRRGLDTDYSSIGEYSTDVFTDEAVSIIRNHNVTNGPLFLYLAHLAPHTGNPDNPFQAPEDEIAKHAHIKDPERRVYAAMVSRLDDSVGRVMSALRQADMLNNSIVLFISDNGAVTFGVHSNRGSNYPLRGLKETPWEGGIRGVAALWSPMLNQTRRVSNQLMHVSDWLPTLYSAAGLDTSELGNIDGMDQWDSLSNSKKSLRTEVFHNYDEIENYSSLRVGYWKYVEGSAQGGKFDLWYGDSSEEYEHIPYDIDEVLNSKTSHAIFGQNTDRQSNKFTKQDREYILRLRQESTISCGNFVSELYRLFMTNFTEEANDTLRENMVKVKRRVIREMEEIRRKHPIGSKVKTFPDDSDERRLLDASDVEDIFACDPLKAPCIFNLEKDPCEKINMANVFSDLVTILRNRVNELKKMVVKPRNIPGDLHSNPALYNDTWTHWGDFESRDVASDYGRMTKVVLASLPSSLHEHVAHLTMMFVDVVSELFSFFPLLLFNGLFIQDSKAFLPVTTLMLCSVICIAIYAILRRYISLSDMNNGQMGKNYSVSVSLRKKQCSVR